MEPARAPTSTDVRFILTSLLLFSTMVQVALVDGDALQWGWLFKAGSKLASATSKAQLFFATR